jgi:hypothetical protein
MADDNNLEPSIEELQKRYKSLETKKITAEANLRTSNQRLEDLKKQARQKYGADDLESLRAKLEEMRQENERKLLAYERHLAEIEASLSEVETDHAEIAKQESQA